MLAPKTVQTHYSPDENYQLIVKKVPMLFAMPGQGGDHLAVVELRNKNNRLLNRLSHRDEEAVMLREIDVAWQEDYVSFAVARVFELDATNEN